MTATLPPAKPPSRDAHGRSVRKPASVARRAAARLVDFTICTAIFVLLMYLLALASSRPEDGTGILLISITGTFMIYIVYEVGLMGLLGRTAGKHLMGIEVIRIADGGRPGVGQSFLRSLVPTLLLVGFFSLYPLPYLLAAAMGDHRWPNDRLAGTWVVARPG